MPKASADGPCIQFQRQVSVRRAWHVVCCVKPTGPRLCPVGTYDILREAAPTQESVGLTRKANARRGSNRVSALGFQETAISELQRIWQGLLEAMRSLREGPKLQWTKAILLPLSREGHPIVPYDNAQWVRVNLEWVFLPQIIKSLFPDKND